MRKKHFWSSDGIITLVATLLGVFLALYLNEWTASRKQKRQMDLAAENILMEIEANRSMLNESVRNYSEMLETYIFFDTCLNSDGEVVSTVGNMNSFKAAHPGLLNTIDSLRMDDGRYKYTSMNLNLNFTLELVELRTIAWETLKNSAVISSFSFSYLMQLEYINKSVNAIIQLNNEIYNDARKFLQGDMTVLGNLIYNVRMAIYNEQQLIVLYDEIRDKKLK